MKALRSFSFVLVGIAFSSQVFAQVPTDTVVTDTVPVDTVITDTVKTEMPVPAQDKLICRVAPMDSDTIVGTMVVEDPVPQAVSENGLNEGTLKELLSASVGKTASEVGLYSNSFLAERSKALLGADFEVVTEKCNVETPVAMSGEIFTFSGRDTADNPTMITTFVYDAANDNLNIVVKKDGQGVVFAEKGELPQATSEK